MNEERNQRSEKIERMRIDQITLVGLSCLDSVNWIELIGSAGQSRLAGSADYIKLLVGQATCLVCRLILQ